MNFVNSVQGFELGWVAGKKIVRKKVKKSIAYGFHFDTLRAPRRPQGQQDSMLADR